MSTPLPRPLVLLVEDSEDDAFFFRWTVEKCGIACDVVHAVDGAHAIEHLETVRNGGCRKPDLVFLDLKLPALSGFEVLAWIRAQHFEPALDVAVLSGSEHTSDIQRAHLLGASGYYVKPLSIEQLRARFNSWITKQQAGRNANPVETHALASPSGTA